MLGWSAIYPSGMEPVGDASRQRHTVDRSLFHGLSIQQPERVIEG